MNMPYPSRKGKNDPEGDSDLNRAATATIGPGCTSPGGKAVVLVSEDEATSLVSVVQAVPAQDPRSKAAANGQGVWMPLRGEGIRPPQWAWKAWLMAWWARRAEH